MREKYHFIPNTAIDQQFKATQVEVQNRFVMHKALRKQSSANDQTQMENDLITRVNGSDPHTIMHTFEKNYLNNGGDWGNFKIRLQSAFPGASITFRPFDGYEEVYVTLPNVNFSENIGRVELDAHRFNLLAHQPISGVPIYQRRGDPSPTPRHYLLLPNGSFIRRFVTRGLSGDDGMQISVGGVLRAHQSDQTAQVGEVGGNKHGVGTGAVLSQSQQVLSHTRGWGGNKRFISTGVSNHAVFSTRGLPFTSMYGIVTVDLALVPLANIVDIHTPAAASAILGIPAASILTNEHHVRPNNLAGQQYLALRDVIRTRELLIHGTIPRVAIQCNSPVRGTLLAVGFAQRTSENAEAENIPAGFPPNITAVKTDHLNYLEKHSNKRWHYFEFSTSTDCESAFDSIPVVEGQLKVRFNKYTPLRPDGMV